SSGRRHTRSKRDWSSDVCSSDLNAQFERVCFSRYLYSSPDVFLDPGQWEDTAALAAANGAPRSLDLLGIFLGGEKKDTAGTRLRSEERRVGKEGRTRREALQ